MIAPDVFELSDIDGHSSAIAEDVPAEYEENVREAVNSCPEGADFDLLSPSAALDSALPEGEPPP
ncbi:ferredoxin [Yinghuangia aomiensis]